MEAWARIRQHVSVARSAAAAAMQLLSRLLGAGGYHTAVHQVDRGGRCGRTPSASEPNDEHLLG